jgi:hypothetical protein
MFSRHYLHSCHGQLTRQRNPTLSLDLPQPVGILYFWLYIVISSFRGQKGRDSYIRVLFSGQPLVTSTPLGVLDMIKYEEFVGYPET